MEDYNKLTLKYYDNESDNYAKKNDENEEMKKFHKLFSRYLKEGKVYDIGCGTGRDVAALQDLNFDVEGLDCSTGMLNVATRNFPNSKFFKFDMVEDDYQRLGRAEGLWACTSLLHLNVIQFNKVIEQLYYVLKDGGVFYLSMKTADTTYSDLDKGRFFQYYEPNELVKIVESKGFTVCESINTTNGNNKFINLILIKKNIN